MKDLLGGKGSGLAEMTNAGLPVPPGLHDLDRRVPRVLSRTTARCRRRSTRRCSTHLKRLEKTAKRSFGSKDESAARVRAVGREVLDARHDGHDPQPRPERRDRRGAQGEDRERPLRLRQLPPLHPDVRQRRARDPEGQVRARVRGGQAREGRQGRPAPRRGGASRGRRPLQEGRQGADEARLPAGPARAAAPGARRGVPLLAEPAREGIPPHLRDPGPHRHRRQRAGDGVRQHRRSLGHGRRVHAQSRHRREGVLRRVPDQRAGRGRRRRHSHAATRSASSKR